MSNFKDKLMRAREHYANRYNEPRIIERTLIQQVAADGKIDIVEFKQLPTTLVASDYSVSSLMKIAPDLLKPVPLLDGNELRTMEQVENALDFLNNYKQTINEPQTVEDNG